ncbi:MAG: hypothetical protein JOS17DRAFT_741070 [Linnemannia elongata]|nr:MAG: hypothetical protein JOS17DRAFT_741070 [Linnemannia elongata]
MEKKRLVILFYVGVGSLMRLSMHPSYGSMGTKIYALVAFSQIRPVVFFSLLSAGTSIGVAVVWVAKVVMGWG